MSVHAYLPRHVLTIGSAGVPPVLRPGWADCYNFAMRVEYKGLIEVVFGSRAENLSRRVRELAEV
jgi:hypothetical protein